MRSAKSTAVVVWFVLAVVGLGLSGCYGHQLGWESWFDPSKPVKSPEQGMVNPIFTQVGPTDQTTELVPNATFPTPEDLRYVEEDYILGPTDVLRISVLDLLQGGVETIMERQVSHSGYVDLLLAGSVKAAGLTKDQLTERIKKAYQPDILKDPSVSVTIVGPRQNVFSVLGAVGSPGTYGILRRNFTLLEALALAGDVSQVNIEWAYVYRPVKKAKKAAAPPAEMIELPPLPTIPTMEPATKPATGTMPATMPAPTKQEKLDELEKALSAAASAPAAETEVRPSTTTRIAPADLKAAVTTGKWVYSGGRWILVPAPAKQEAPKTGPREADKGAKDKFGWGKFDMSNTMRIIAIDLKELKAGNPRMNIVIRENDIIQVPTLEVGEFYVMGEVLRPGVYSLTGRRVTAKMAVAAAGNLGPLAWPNNSILIRRVGRDQEQTVPLKLQDIFHGREPDILLKPNDVIAVGSYWAATPLAVWRNAFRMTYGFGFIYDRNYSEYEFEIPIIAPKSDLRNQW